MFTIVWLAAAITVAAWLFDPKDWGGKK